MRFVPVVLLLAIAACSDPVVPAPSGHAGMLVYNPGDAVAHVTAHDEIPAVGYVMEHRVDFAAMTVGDVPARTSICFTLRAGEVLFLEARVGSYTVRSTARQLQSDGQYSWIIGDPVVESGSTCEPSP